MGHKRGRKKKPKHDRNKSNTSQPRPGFVPSIGDKSKNNRKGKEEKLIKVSKKRKR